MSRSPQPPMVDDSYIDAFGQEHTVPESTLAALGEAMGSVTDAGPLFVHPGETPPVGPARISLEDGSEMEVAGRLPPDLPLGYHRLLDDSGARLLIVAPSHCYLPEGLREWGWAVQLYATRSSQSWGMGDFGDLRQVSQWARKSGAGMVLVSPMLAVAPTLPQEPSPYFPSSRRFLNPIYLRIEEVDGSSTSQRAKIGRALNSASTIERDEVWRLKLAALEDIWRANGPEPGFGEWRRSQGKALQEFAVWCVVAEHHGGDWRSWPDHLAHPSASGLAEIAGRNQDRVDFHQWLQWLCRRQLQAAAEPVKLMQDLPIGFDPAGADAWAWQHVIAPGVSVGAPPDEFNTRGQDWGLPPFVPHRLRAAGYEPFIQTIRSSLLHGGGLRIDHVMGLFRQFWIPEGASPSEGAYVRYPAAELLDIIALESFRAGAVVVGEDLGTVEPGVREGLAERRMLSYRLLWFEQDLPSTWPELSMASVTTHDLPTLVGLWKGSDLQEQKSLDMAPNQQSTDRILSHVSELANLDDSAEPAEVVMAVHSRLAEAPSRLVCATLDDLALAERRPNMPGADAKRANWSLSLPLPLEDLMAQPLADDLAAVFNRHPDELQEPDDART